MNIKTKSFSSSIINIFQYYSDLHIEHQKNLLPNITPLSNDYLFSKDKYKSLSIDYDEVTFIKNIILAGDIGNPTTDIYWSFLKNINSLFDRCFLICGNHEYYGNDISYINKLINNNIQKYQLNKIYFLNNSSISFDSFKIIGSTMWNYISTQHKDEITNYMNDYKLIQNFNTDKCNLLHNQSVKYIESELNNTELPCIVVTHHAPSFNNTSHIKYKNNSTTHAFASNVEYLLNNHKCIQWIFGHTHHNDSNLHPKLKTNQLGYN